MEENFEQLEKNIQAIEIKSERDQLEEKIKTVHAELIKEKIILANVNISLQRQTNKCLQMDDQLAELVGKLAKLHGIDILVGSWNFDVLTMKFQSN